MSTALLAIYFVSAAALLVAAFWIEHLKEKRLLAAIKESEERIVERIVKSLLEVLPTEEITVHVKTMSEKAPGELV
jgi:hypothetical protein